MKKHLFFAGAAIVLAACTPKPAPYDQYAQVFNQPHNQPPQYYPQAPAYPASYYPQQAAYYSNQVYYPAAQGQYYDPNTGFRRPNIFRNAVVGAMIGAGAGQLIGKDSEATATGAVIGGLIGSQINEM